MGVTLNLLPAHSTNHGSRYFPHAGFLGLTPVKLAGLVRTRIDEQGKPLLASSVQISVKCYESRLGRLGGTFNNTLVNISQTLWSAPSTSTSDSPSGQFAELGDTDLPFRVTLPIDTPGFSTSNFQTYRVFWRVEAVIEHVPIPGVGSRQLKSFDLALTRYDAPARPLKHAYTQSARHLRYKVTVPSQPIAPQEPIPIALNLCIFDPSHCPQKIVASIERRLDLSTDSSSTTPPATLSRLPQHLSSPEPTSAASSTTTLVGGIGPSHVKDAQPSSSSSSSASKSLVAPISSVEIQDLTPESDGSYVRFLTMQLPAPKSSHHWAIGETMQTSLASVRFFVCVKVYLQTPSGSTEVIPLEEQELYVVAVDQVERQRILDVYNASRTSRPSGSTSGSSSASRRTSASASVSLSSTPSTRPSSAHSGNRHLPSPPPSPRSSSSGTKPTRRPKTTSQIDTKSKSVRDHQKTQLISPASSRARSQTPDFPSFPTVTATPTDSTLTLVTPPPLPPIPTPTPSSAGSSSFPTVLKVLPMPSRHRSGGISAMLGKRPHTSSGPGSSREESGRKSQRPRSARGGTAEPMPMPNPPPSPQMPMPIPGSGAAGVPRSPSGGISNGGRPMSPRASAKVAFAFEREQVRKWEKELNHIMLPSSSGDAKAKKAKTSSGAPTSTLAVPTTAGSPPQSPTVPLHSLHYYAGTEDSSTFTYAPPEGRVVEASAVRTYVHEPDVDMGFANGTPLSREQILAWEMEVERFSSASARQAL